MSIPVIDLDPYFSNKNTKEVAESIRQTCKNTGFFYIKNHGVPEALQASMLSNAAQFFDLPREQKRKIAMDKGGAAWRGYFEVGEEQTSGKVDLKQGIYLGTELDANHPKVLKKTPLHGQNIYPQEPAALKQDIQLWLKEMKKLGEKLMEALSQSLYLDRSFFNSTIAKDHMGLLRIFHYPYDANANPELWAVGEHTDYGVMTILMIGDKGLQVKNVENEWINIDPIPNTFVINIGDTLERMTRGLYKSTPHRAKNNLGKSRFSVPYFYDPDWDTKIVELDIKISEEELKVLQKTSNYERWDNVKLETISGSYGEYLQAKVAKALPVLAKDQLK